MQDIQIREARREELPAIVTLYNLMWAGSKTPIAIKTGEGIFERMRANPNQRMYVAEVDGRVVGTFMMIVKDHPATGDARDCVVDNVVVHPRFQGKGIGKQMIRFVTEQGKQSGCARLVIAGGERRDDSHAFYESLGFTRKGYGFVRNITAETG